MKSSWAGVQWGLRPHPVLQATGNKAQPKLMHLFLHIGPIEELMNSGQSSLPMHTSLCLLEGHTTWRRVSIVLQSVIFSTKNTILEHEFPSLLQNFACDDRQVLSALCASGKVPCLTYFDLNIAKVSTFRSISDSWAVLKSCVCSPGSWGLGEVATLVT